MFQNPFMVHTTTIEVQQYTKLHTHLPGGAVELHVPGMKIIPLCNKKEWIWAYRHYTFSTIISYISCNKSEQLNSNLNR